MNEVLDPTIRANLLTEVELRTKAMQVLTSSVAADLTEDKIRETQTRLVERAHYEPAKQPGFYNVVAANIVARSCLEQLMCDENGRSEFHIAAEVCQMNLAVRHLAVFFDFPELIPVPDLDVVGNSNGGKSRASRWVPIDSPFDFVTIDGRSERQKTELVDGKFVTTASLHNTWLNFFLDRTLPTSAEVGGLLAQLEPPVKLSSGKEVDRDGPRYYVLRKDQQHTEEVLPRDRVLVPA